jgi:hypothetical protein
VLTAHTIHLCIRVQLNGVDWHQRAGGSSGGCSHGIQRGIFDRPWICGEVPVVRDGFFKVKVPALSLQTAEGQGRGTRFLFSFF